MRGFFSEIIPDFYGANNMNTRPEIFRTDFRYR